MSAPSRRELVRYLTDQGLSERRSLKVAGMSASALRYQPAQDRNATLKEQINALAQRHRRYGAGMIYLKLRAAYTSGLPSWPAALRRFGGDA